MDEINTTLLEKSLGYHGLPLQKAWEEEKGISDLKKLGLSNLDYSVYFARQKSLTFSDRAKRLRLHQFMCKKANYLFDTKSLQSNRIDKEKQLQGSSIIIPPFDFFANLSGEVRSAQFYNCLQPGDTIYGSVASKTSYGLLFKVLCSTGSMSRFVADLNIKAFIYSENLVSAVDKKNVSRSFQSNDYICAEVLEVLPDVKKIGCGMRAIHDRHDSGPALGLVVIEEFPAFYKICLEGKDNKTFNSSLEESPGFYNPTSVDNLMLGCGLDIRETYTNMSSLKGKFPQEEYATELRHQQTSKLAVRSVAEGIEHFKNGRHTEAFQCLNKALSIDPKNVEGLVARGALCANSGYFKKAVVDFEAALKLNPTHVNARKYLCETLVALGRNFEDENKIDDAKKAYQDCLKINPHHEEAQSSLDFLKSKPNLKQIVEPAELEMPLNINVTSHKEHDFGKKDDSGKKEKKNKKEKKKRNKKRHSSSSESSSDSSDSKTSDSSSDSSSSDSSSDSTDSGSNARSKKKDRKDKSHQKSLSPLSKRMAIMSENIQTRDSSSYQYNQAYDNLPGSSGNLDDYEMKVRKFLEMPRDEDDYEERVRKFMAEASKLQKAKQQEEKASKKKKKKDERKLKKESKKKKKKDEKKKSKSKKEKGDYDIQDKKIRDALKLLESFPSALTDLYGKGGDRGNEKDKDDPQSKQKMDIDHGHGIYDKEDDFNGGKWKMMFSKDERNNEQMSKNKQSKQYAFGYDSEEEEQQRNAQNQPSTSSQLQAGTSSGGYGGGSSVNVFEKASKKRHLTPPKPKEIIPPAPPVKSGPVVLDKFGNFRLATTDPIKPPEPSHSRRSRSRSRKKYDSSSSRSKSRSPRRRSRSGSYPRHKYSRSHSRSYGRRSGSSRSRSYSRSRSRSRSGDRRRFSKNYRGRGGGGSNYDRGTYYKPRFSTNIRGRGRGSNGNFRDNRDFRGRGRFDRTPYRPRPGGGRGNGNRHYDRFDYRDRRRDSRSRSFSIERERPPRSPNDERHYGSDHERDTLKDKKLPPSPPMPGSEIEGRWADMDTAQPEEYDKMLDKARKEKKEEMLERNKDIVKKSTGW